MSDVTISLSGQGLALTFPSDVSGRTHTLEVPMNIGGLQIIRKALMARQREEDRRLGTQASPTQAMVEEWLATERRERKEAAAKVEPSHIIAGLDLSTLDLDL